MLWMAETQDLATVKVLHAKDMLRHRIRNNSEIVYSIDIHRIHLQIKLHNTITHTHMQIGRDIWRVHNVTEDRRSPTRQLRRHRRHTKKAAMDIKRQSTITELFQMNPTTRDEVNGLPLVVCLRGLYHHSVSSWIESCAACPSPDHQHPPSPPLFQCFHICV